MGEFRIGRKFASHSYPDTRAATTVPYARNFAVGPGTVTDVTVGTPVPWGVIEAIAAWGNTTTYALGALVSFTDGNTYISLAGGNLNNQPDVSPAFWALNSIVPITPRSTGLIRIAGVISLKSAGDAAIVAVQVRVNGFVFPIPDFEAVTIGSGELGVLPILVETIPLTIGVTAAIEVLVTAIGPGSVSLTAASSTLDVQEVQAATG